MSERRPLRAAVLAAGLTLALAAAPSCVLQLSDGLTVELTATGRSGAAETADGRSLLVEAAWVYLAMADLTPCPGSADARAPVWSVGPAPAFAHGLGSGDGRHLDAEQPVPLHAGGRVTVGLLRPPPGSYCALELLVQAAPAELAEGPLARSARAIEMRAVDGDGSLVRAGAPGARSFSLPLLRPGGTAAPLVLDLESPPRRLRLELDLGPALREHRADAGPVNLGLDLLTSLERGWTVVAEPAEP